MEIKTVVRKLVAALAITALGICSTLSANAENETESDRENTIIYRLYNPNGGEHFYTADSGGKDYLITVGWNYEGIAWIAPGRFIPETNEWENVKGLTPVYRVYNPNSGEHFYLQDERGRDWLVSLGWRDEGIGWYTEEDETTCNAVVYRLYNPNATDDVGGAGAHFYTMSESDRDYLDEIGWNYEGISWMSAHSIAETSLDKEATCDEDGYEGRVLCVNCGKEFKGKVIPANNNHDVVYHVALYEEKSNGVLGGSTTYEYYCPICEKVFFEAFENDEWLLYERNQYTPSTIEHFNTCHGTNVSKAKIDEYDNEIARLLSEYSEYLRLCEESYDDPDLCDYYMSLANDNEDRRLVIETEKKDYINSIELEYRNIPATIKRILVSPGYYSCNRCNKTSEDGVHWD